MVIRSVNPPPEDLSQEMELLDQTCLDLVAQIEQLKKENARLKERIENSPARERTAGQERTRR